MGSSQPIFTREEVRLFFFELRSKFRDGVRSADAILYIFFTLVGVGWATWAIPAINNTDTSPETLGVYVIGFLVTVFLDAMLTWKKQGADNRFEQAIAVVCLCLALICIVIVSYFSLHDTSGHAASGAVAAWKAGSYSVLWVTFGVSVLMALVLSGFEAGTPRVGPLDLSVDDVESRNG